MLPDADPYQAWSNVEIITDRGRSLEIELLVVGPAGLYVVELKAWSGASPVTVTSGSCVMIG